jgi:hypothetical protein
MLLIWRFYMHAANDGAAATQDTGDSATLRFNNEYGHEVQLKDDDPSAPLVWLLYMHAANDGAAVTHDAGTTQDTGNSTTADGHEIKFTESDAALFNHE